MAVELGGGGVGGESKLQPEKEGTRLRRPPPCPGQTEKDWEQSPTAGLRSRELVWLSLGFVPEAKSMLSVNARSRLLPEAEGSGPFYR